MGPYKAMRAATSYLMRQVGVRRLESFKAADL